MAAPPYPAYGSGLRKPRGWVCTDCRMAAPPYPAYGAGCGNVYGAAETA
jgi:hypothetical protein